MLNDKEKFYDTIIQVALTNFYTLSKNNNEGKIVLNNFYKKDKSHLCLLRIAEYSTLFGSQVFIKTNKLNGFIIKKKMHGANFRTTKDNDYLIDCNEFIFHIENANQSFGIFEEIWENYFSKKGKEE